MKTYPIMALAALAALAVLTPWLSADEPRQKYGAWEYNQEKGYYYRKLEYKADPKAAEYTYEYVIYYKNDPQLKNWVYFYNPKTEKVWVRYPTVNHPMYGKDVQAGKELWSVLPPDKRQKYVKDIPAADYPPPSGKECPYVPGCKDQCTLMLPPKDLP